MGSTRDHHGVIRGTIELAQPGQWICASCALDHVLLSRGSLGERREHAPKRAEKLRDHREGIHIEKDPKPEDQARVGPVSRGILDRAELDAEDFHEVEKGTLEQLVEDEEAELDIRGLPDGITGQSIHEEWLPREEPVTRDGDDRQAGERNAHDEEGGDAKLASK